MTPEQELQQVQAMARVEAVLEDMHSRLFGNGQPGIVKDYNDRIRLIEKDHDSFTGVVRFLKYAATIGPLLVAGTEFIIHVWARH